MDGFSEGKKKDLGMAFKRDGKGCCCGGGPGLQISSIVSEISHQPCLNNSAIKGNKMLKPEKWQAVFDSEGRVSRFRKALKSIVLGGVDPSIRAEVWEFLLGCYALGTTTEYRRQLRMDRRERYKDLIKQCQAMHSSIGTGTLAYVVGSKVMDVRTVSKDNGHHEEVESRRSSQDMINDMEADCDLKNYHPESVDACQRGSSSDSTDLVSVRGSIDSVTNCSSYVLPPSGPYNRFSSKSREEMHESQYVTDSYFNFPPLPVTNLFKNNDVGDIESEVRDDRPSTDRRLRLEDQPMHSFQIDNNVDLIMESNALPSTDFLSGSNGENEMFNSSIQGPTKESTNLEYSTITINRHRISDVPEAAMINATSHVATADEERVSEWLWTLHRIVVDVVRTDSHLEFYEDAKNMARMSDILAVYAWVDPATGYCQGMSDLLSPFVVLYEDNADAFWCFEMLLRRTRENFRMEGPTGVIKQLQSLWRVLEQIDAEMYRHLSLIGAESLHFAFRMLLVLFRRELSFNESLCMWEMMWAADFDEAVTQKLEKSCLEPLVLRLPRDLNSERIEESTENGKINSRGTQSQDVGNADVSKTDSNGMRSASIYPFCGLSSASFWCRNDHMQICTIISTKNGDDELVVFCVAAILSINRHKVIKEACSIDDLIKMFNDKLPKINVRRCIRMAIKLRKKYFYKSWMESKRQSTSFCLQQAQSSTSTLEEPDIHSTDINDPTKIIKSTSLVSSER